MRRKTALQKAGKGFPLHSGSDATSLNTEEPTPPFLPSSLPPFLSRCAIAEPADRIVCEVKVRKQTLNSLLSGIMKTDPQVPGFFEDKTHSSIAMWNCGCKDRRTDQLSWRGPKTHEGTSASHGSEMQIPILLLLFLIVINIAAAAAVVIVGSSGRTGAMYK